MLLQTDNHASTHHSTTHIHLHWIICFFCFLFFLFLKSHLLCSPSCFKVSCSSSFQFIVRVLRVCLYAKNIKATFNCICYFNLFTSLTFSTRESNKMPTKKTKYHNVIIHSQFLQHTQKADNCYLR